MGAGFPSVTSVPTTTTLLPIPADGILDDRIMFYLNTVINVAASDCLDVLNSEGRRSVNLVSSP